MPLARHVSVGEALHRDISDRIDLPPLNCSCTYQHQTVGAMREHALAPNALSVSQSYRFGYLHSRLTHAALSFAAVLLRLGSSLEL